MVLPHVPRVNLPSLLSESISAYEKAKKHVFTKLLCLLFENAVDLLGQENGGALLENVRERGEQMRAGLEKLKQKYPQTVAGTNSLPCGILSNSLLRVSSKAVALPTLTFPPRS